MKRMFTFMLAVLLLAAAFTGCKPKLSKGSDNDKLLGAWVILSNSPGQSNAIDLWEFRSDGTMRINQFVQLTRATEENAQLYEEAPLGDKFVTFTISEKNQAKTEVLEKYSYSEGHGLEYKKSNGIICFYTKAVGCNFVFDSENKFTITADGVVYHGYKLKTSLLAN